MAFVVGWRVQDALCKALGIEPSVTESVEILPLRADGPVRIRVTQFMTVEHQERLVRVFLATDFTEVEP